MKTVYCGECHYYFYNSEIRIDKICLFSGYWKVTPIGRYRDFELCEEKNAKNDCPDYKKKKSIWEKIRCLFQM